MNKYENLIPTQTHVIPLKEKHPSNFRFGNKVVYIPRQLQNRELAMTLFELYLSTF